MPTERCPLRSYQNLPSLLMPWATLFHEQLHREQACYLWRSSLCRTHPLRQHSVLGSDMSLFKLADENAAVSTLLTLHPLSYSHLQWLYDGNNTLMAAYQGKTTISDFQSFKHTEYVWALEGPLSHNLTKKASERNKEMGVGRELVLERGPKARGRQGEGYMFFFHSFWCPGLSRKIRLQFHFHPISDFSPWESSNS